MKSFKYIYDPAVLAINMGLSGKEADLSTKMYGSVLVKKQPFLGIPLPDISYLKPLIESADLSGLYKNGDDFSICAFYKHDEYFPIARSYYIQFKSQADCEIIAHHMRPQGPRLEYICDLTIFSFTEHLSYEHRVDEFFERIKDKSAGFKGLFDGRKENTTTESAMYLSSNGCMVCGEDKEQLFSTTVTGDKGALFGFDLCSTHAEECKLSNSNLEYLSSVFGVAAPFVKKDLPRKEVLNMVSDMLINDFECRIDKIENNTITAYRNKTGFKLVFRLTSELNYGYMIYQPGRKKDVARFDSANHHDVDYGPDHLHRNLKNKKLKPESSFTTGFPVIDKVTIKKVLDERESEYAKANKPSQSDS
ncbi:DUF6516 family protein [Shewanella sp. PP-He15 brown]